jgi:hypothetical protein
VEVFLFPAPWSNYATVLKPPVNRKIKVLTAIKKAVILTIEILLQKDFLFYYKELAV